MDRDTPRQQLERYHALLRDKAPQQRLRAAGALCAAVRSLAGAGLRARHPGASDRELDARLVRQLYGEAAARRLFGSVPADGG
jgi:hypothetical protein